MQSSWSHRQESTGNVDLKSLPDLFRRYWILFAASIFLCLLMAFLYAKFSTPLYEIQSSLLIDPSGKDRSLGESRLIEGSVGLVETEKNLLNEIALLKSYNLVEKTVEDLNFQVTYHKEDLNQKEQYGFFPFSVHLADASKQLVGIPIYVEILSVDTIRISIDTEILTIYDPTVDAVFELEEHFEFSRIYCFGDQISHPYFEFTINLGSQELINPNRLEPLLFQVHTKASITQKYLAGLEVSRAGLESTILNLKLTSPSVRKSADFLNRLCDNYMTGRLETRNQIALNKAMFLQNQLSAVSDSLDLAERKLEYFKRSRQTVDLKQLVSSSLTKIQDLEANQARLQLNLKYYQSQLKSLNDNNVEDKITPPSLIGIDDPLLNKEIIDLKALYSERERLSFIKGEESIDLEIINNQIKTAKNSIERNLQNIVQSTQLALNDINSRVGTLESSIDQVPRSQKQLMSFERKRNLYENLFIYLSQELAKAGIAQAEDIPDIAVLEEARMAGKGPVSPKKKLIMLMGLLIGSIIPMAWVVVKHSFNDVIESIEDIERNTHIPVIASIVQQSKRETRSESLLRWELDESFRDLAAKLKYLDEDGRNTVYGITSMLPAEGKSFCASNLALQFAHNKENTILVNLDFRKPESRMVDPSKSKFSAYLTSDDVALENVVHPWEGLENYLSYIPVDLLSTNPQYLLSGPRMRTLITELKENYDRIILDSPAIGIVSDYLLVAAKADVHLFLLRHNLSRVRFLRDMEKMLGKEAMEKNHIVYNGVPSRRHKYGYAGYYFEGAATHPNGMRRKKFGLNNLLEKITPN